MRRFFVVVAVCFSIITTSSLRAFDVSDMSKGLVGCTVGCAVMYVIAHDVHVRRERVLRDAKRVRDIAPDKNYDHLEESVKNAAWWKSVAGTALLFSWVGTGCSLAYDWWVPSDGGGGSGKTQQGDTETLLLLDASSTPGPSQPSQGEHAMPASQPPAPPRRTVSQQTQQHQEPQSQQRMQLEDKDQQLNKLFSELVELLGKFKKKLTWYDYSFRQKSLKRFPQLIRKILYFQSKKVSSGLAEHHLVTACCMCKSVAGGDEGTVHQAGHLYWQHVVPLLKQLYTHRAKKIERYGTSKKNENPWKYVSDFDLCAFYSSTMWYDMSNTTYQIEAITTAKNEMLERSLIHES